MALRHGILPAGTDPLEQALAEIGEETGLGRDAARLICQSQPLELGGDGCTWRIFPFLFETTNCGLYLSWENDAYRWTDPADVTETENVAWLIDVWRALDLDSRRSLRPAA